MKKIWRFLSIIITILMVIGVALGVSIAIKEKNKNSDAELFSKVQSKEAEVVEFFTYGTSLNFSCRIFGVEKDNYESARLLLIDEKNNESEYKVFSHFEDNNMIITTSNYINDAINLEKLATGKYNIVIRLKVNNSSNHKYYLLRNTSKNQGIEYYTISNNKKVTVEEVTSEANKIKHTYLKVNVEDAEKPANVYDVVIDAGHGGDDSGVTADGYSEADITLDYANLLKAKLEENGLKVKLTRDNSNTENYKEKETYSENGRITIACASKAKYMISLHVNNGNKDFSGLEIYCPCKSNLSFAKQLAEAITENTSMEYSNTGKYKVADGVYVRNFSQTEIDTYANTAEKNGYENYNLTLDTPFLYTIREVGGIATNAFVDGRNKNYSANKYYNSNQGIECYQIELGYIKNDLEIILNEKEQYVQSICDTIVSNIK